MTEIGTGLDGVVVGETALSSINAGGELRYRGYAIGELAENATFEEVAYLLLHGRLPSTNEVNSFRAMLKAQRVLPAPLRRVLEQLPLTTHPMDVLRTGCSTLGCLEPEGTGHPPLAIACRLMAALPSMLLYWHAFTTSLMRIDTSGTEETTAGHFLNMLLDKKPDPLHQHALDASLTLYAEHLFNPSTFAARTIASTQADFYSAITGAIGALRGPLHGGANTAAIALVERYVSPDEAEAGVLATLGTQERVPSFGHPLYQAADPRSVAIKGWAAKLAAGSDDGARLMAVAERIEAVMQRERKVWPNVDFYSAIVYRLCGIPAPMFTPVFAFARIAGWSAHILEQRAGNRVFWPASTYVGPEARPTPTLDQR